MTGQNDRQDRSLTGQVRDQAGHCPLTGRYLQPWIVSVARSQRAEKNVPISLRRSHIQEQVG